MDIIFFIINYIFILIVPALVLSWGNWIKGKENYPKERVQSCKEVENHFHWYRRIATVTFFILLQITVLIITQDSHGRRAGGYHLLIYASLVIVPMYYGLVFYLRNKSFNRNIFLCKQKIISYYRRKDIFKDEKIEQVNIDIENVKNIVWSPLDRTKTTKYEITGFKSFIQDFLRQIIFFPFEIFSIFVKFVYYLINGFSLKYFFKNLLITTDKDEILIQIKSKQDYENIRAYFSQYEIDIDNLKSTLIAEIYYVKD